jgi:large subunit ribosomal protein L23
MACSEGEINMADYINIFPRKTEKAYGQSLNNVYVFDAPVDANKQQIAMAVESQFGVKVIGVKTLIQDGKAFKFSRGKRRYPGTSYHKDFKKAYVTLAKGDSIKVFDEALSDDQPVEKVEKKEKK